MVLQQIPAQVPADPNDMKRLSVVIMGRILDFIIHFYKI